MDYVASRLVIYKNKRAELTTSQPKKDEGEWQDGRTKLEVSRNEIT